MEDYSTFEHTADIGIEAHGRTLEEAFVNAAKGMFSVIAEGSNIGTREKRHIELPIDSDEEQLLVDWLSELLYINDVEGLVFDDFAVKIEDKSLVADVYGEKYDISKHGYGTEIKAITYHMLQIKRNKKGIHIKVLFDI
jgi:SHS2 domain-containing protein